MSVCVRFRVGRLLGAGGNQPGDSPARGCVVGQPRGGAAEVGAVAPLSLPRDVVMSRSAGARYPFYGTIQTMATGQDASGGPTETASTLRAVYFGIEEEGEAGVERTAINQPFATVTRTIVTRYFSVVTPKMRLLWGSRVLRFESVINVGERNDELRIIAVEEV